MTRTERQYYQIYSLYSLSWSFIAAMYPLYLLSRGLDLFEMSLVPAVYWIVSFVFEVPTGAFADLVGRKTSFLLSCAVRATAFGLYALSGTFGAFVFAEFVDALGSTLANGALDAWAVDGIRSEGDSRPTDRFFARGQIFARLLTIVGGLAGGYLAEADMRLPWIAATMSFITTGIIAAVIMREVRAAPRAPVLRGAFVEAIHGGFATVRREHTLLLLCLLTLATAFAILPAYMFWQPRLQGLTGQGTSLMGWVWTFVTLASVCGSALVPRLLGRFPRSALLVGVALWRGTMLALAGAALSFAPALTGLLLMELGSGLGEPLILAWVNEHIRPDQRATVLSVRTMCFTLGGGLGLLCLGLVARDVSIPAAWITSGLLLLLTAPGFVFLSRVARTTESVPQLAPAAVTLLEVESPASSVQSDGPAPALDSQLSTVDRN